MTGPLRLREMTPARAAELLHRVPRLLLPASTLETRGPHLPLGSDSLILDRLADDLSAITGIGRAPIIEYGVHAAAYRARPGTAALSRKTLHRAVNELIAIWEEVAGVRDTLILTAHAADAHLEALSTIRTIGRVRVVDILALDSLQGLRQVKEGLLRRSEVLTSLMLHVSPDLIDTAQLPSSFPVSSGRGAEFYETIKGTLIHHLTDLAKS